MQHDANRRLLPTDEERRQAAVLLTSIDLAVSLGGDDGT